MADWAPKLNALSHTVEDIRAWAGAKEAEGQHLNKMGKDKEVALSSALQQVEELGRRLTVSETGVVPTVPLPPPSAGQRTGAATVHQVQAAASGQRPVTSMSAIASLYNPSRPPLPALFPQGSKPETDVEVKTLIEMATRLGLSVVRPGGGPLNLESAGDPPPQMKKLGKICRKNYQRLGRVHPQI